ncbi:hypothetical protein J8M97_16370 [Gordonia polyisoprenivorans]|uniref:ATP-binding protein n=1 Tax=Gordonia polyisoprenivorans TaxID=84595 RepID=UPI000B99DF9B|nr:ATP-binding protein [Gordonia polyisoprenivorans]OZC29677.1 hypothetical protein CJJ17_23620 [Gordonia polyisoprenivorans]QUD81370.1 hypothetical protein J8M97_16370 [Gordonia polyisoprenivorans]
MTTGLFSPTELGGTAESGFRLRTFQVLNWGTFDSRVWTLRLDGHNGLLTGDIGSGKSTLVDALTTLLLPANRVAYNKAAGADTRERDLRSYVLGHYKSERNEFTGSSRPVALRGTSSYSVILGVFGNAGYDEDVTLAQVFSMKTDSGQPDRFFTVTDRALDITEDFTDFGSDLKALRKRLRTGGTRIHDHFPEYGRDYRRALAINSEQAMELFHQTVSMKAVGNLNDFVRDHMLEPFDSSTWVDNLVSHFQDLTAAHDAVVLARTQLAELEPLLEEYDKYVTLTEQINRVRARRDSLRYWFAQLRHDLHTEAIDRDESESSSARDELARVDVELAHLRSRLDELKITQAGLGGNEIAVLEQRIAETSRQRDERRRQFDRYATLLAEASLASISDIAGFSARRTEVTASLDAVDTEITEARNALTELGVDQRARREDAARLGAEIASLRGRTTNIPERNLRIRALVCQGTGLAAGELPFVGELIGIRDDETRWEGAAERVLRGFGLSLLVSGEHYNRVSGWINDNHLGGRIVYYRVPPRVSSQGVPTPPPDVLAHKLDIKESPFYDWLEQKLFERARHICTDTMDRFRGEEWAVTSAGQIRSAGGRHEKDDSHRIDDRRNFVLGWRNEQKVAALIADGQHIQAELNRLDAEIDAHLSTVRALEDRRGALDKLTVFESFDTVDWMSVAATIADLTQRKTQLEQSSAELARVTADIESTSAAITMTSTHRDSLRDIISGLDTTLAAARAGRDEAASILAEDAAESAREHFESIATTVAGVESAELTLQSAGAVENRLYAALTADADDIASKASKSATRVVNRMSEFIRNHPVLTTEVDADIAAAGEFQELRRRLADDDLPRFEAEFKTYLNTNAIRDIAIFSAQLNKEVEQIRTKITTINESLSGIEYNTGRHIRLEVNPTPNAEIRQFREDLRRCSDGTFGADTDDHYAEEKFLLVKSLVERFRGREGHTDVDRKWTRFVTDVRNWVSFAASERVTDTDIEFENYTDSDGKSGGQKEKLAYTILAASLAYQFDLKWGVHTSRDFRFVVIDEAFGRGSDESARYALSLFRRLGLQLLIVTPLTKIYTIEPFVESVGYVENRDGSNSQLQCLTIDQYRAQRRAREMITLVDGETGTA